MTEAFKQMTAQHRAMRQRLLPSALAYAKRGWHVFPVYGIQLVLSPKGEITIKCGCGKADCHDVGKHPATAHGFKDATIDPKRIARWFNNTHWYGVAIATAASNLVVIDVDPKHNGHVTWRAILDAEGAAVAKTVRAITGGAPVYDKNGDRPHVGSHLYYQMPPGVTVPTGAGRLGPGVDVTNYVIAPESLHSSGSRYTWMPDTAPDEIEMLALPDSLLRRIQAGAPSAPRPARQSGPMDRSGLSEEEQAEVQEKSGFDLVKALAGVEEGERQTQLFKAACSFRGSATSMKVALQACREAAAKCKPPFTARPGKVEGIHYDGIEVIVRRVYRNYRAGWAEAVTSTKPVIDLGADPELQLNGTLKAMAEASSKVPRLFSMGRAVARLREASVDDSFLEELNDDSWLSEVIKDVAFTKQVGFGRVPDFPSPALLRALRGQPNYPFAPIDYVVRAPFFTAAGALVAQSGSPSGSPRLSGARSEFEIHEAGILEAQRR